MNSIDQSAPAGGVSARLTSRVDSGLARSGDVYVGCRLNVTQAVANASNDPVTHAAIIAGARTVEIGPDGVLSRSLEEFHSAYATVGIARPRLCEDCRAEVVERASAAMSSGLRYDWDACALLEAVSLLRSFAPRAAEANIIAAAAAPARRVARRSGVGALTCSGLVEHVLSAARCCRPTPSWPRKPRVAAWKAMPTLTDLRPGLVPARIHDSAVVRVLTSPTDLWVADFWEFRAVISGDHVTYLIDLPTERAPDLLDLLLQREEGRCA